MEVVVRIKAIALIAALSGGLMVSAASAMTIVKPEGLTVSAGEQAAYKKVYHKRNKYRAGGRYNRAPSNWHRFDKRPGDWQRRGCIVVGPIWWCP
jgi:hypothetical protein